MSIKFAITVIGALFGAFVVYAVAVYQAFKLCREMDGDFNWLASSCQSIPTSFHDYYVVVWSPLLLLLVSIGALLGAICLRCIHLLNRRKQERNHQGTHQG